MVTDFCHVVEDLDVSANAQSESAGERKYQELKTRFMDSLERRQRTYTAGEQDPGDRKALVKVLWFNHPILNLMLHSMSVATGIQNLLFMLAFSGTAATSALFFIPTAAPPDCEVPENFWDKLPYDIVVSAISTVVATVPGTIIMTLHSLEIKPKSRDRDEFRRKRRLETLNNRGVMLFGHVLVFSHLTTVASFLANVSKSDQNHWLVATACTFTTSWLHIMI